MNKYPQTVQVEQALPIPEDQLEQLLQLQRDALEAVAVGEDTDRILDRLCLLTEAMVPNSVASIMLFDRTGTMLEVRAAPSIPPDGINALNGLQPGPAAGSCGTAVYTGKPVFVENTFTDPRWAPLVDIARRFRLQACWSMPIRVANDAVIGSFAISSFERRPPDPFHQRLLDTATYLAGIILQREEQAQRLTIAAIAFEHMREGVMIADSRNRIVQVNRAFERITGYTAAEAIGQSPNLLKSGHQPPSFYRQFYQSLQDTGEWLGEIWNRRKDGSIYPQWLSVRAIYNPDGSVCKYVSVFADITETKDSERKLWQLAHHDALSNLPNRLLLGVRLEHAVQRAHRSNRRLAVLFIDLDRFKDINDSLGHQAGDELLQQVAARLRAAVHEDDTVARLGGDEFVVLLEAVPDANAVRRIAERIVDRLTEPFTVRGRPLFVTASVGVSLYPDDATEAEALLQHADAAMYRAKASGRNRIGFYAPEMTLAVQRRLDLEQDLRRAISDDQLLLHYQPQFASADGRLVSIEALVRWNHPQHGLLGPDRFIGLAEETGLIDQLGLWVTEHACRQALAWREQGAPPFTLAVNLSPYQLRGATPGRLADALAATGYPADAFEFEVTESLFMADGDLALRHLEDLRQRVGMQVALDDFGTGYSSLSQLKRMPIGKLKIDRSFVSDLPDDGNDAAIVRAIVLMAHTLGLTVTAEGVETPAQHQYLCDLGCDHLQGYLYSRPLPAEAMGEMLARSPQQAFGSAAA